jgi:DNA-binding beta-propeller fold protein YncE/plastocyanin
MPHRQFGTWSWLLLAFGAAVAVAFAACSGSKSTNPQPAPTVEVKPAAIGSPSDSKAVPASTGGGLTYGRPADPPDPKSFPSTFSPQPGGLYFVTNASISYNSQAKFPWIIIIDAKTKKIVAGAAIPEVTTSPHGIAVSPDGTQAYLPAGSALPNFSTATDGTRFKGGVTVVDMKTLKTIQQIDTKDAPHHIQVLNDKYVMADAWGVDQVVFVMDPNDKNKIINEINAKAFDGRPYIAFPSPDGKYIYATVRPNPGSNDPYSWLSRIDLANWKVEKVLDLGGEGAVWTTFGRDGKYIYVTVPGEDHVVKVDMLATPPKIAGTAATGRGPYGLNLSADEKTLWVVSKGEGGRGQRGGTFVTIDTETMRLLEERPSCLAFVCQADHAVISPDGTEFWIDNNMGYVSVFDMKTLDMIAEITMPFLADPHGGVFVQYDKDGKGHVVMDPGGARGGVSPHPFDNANGVPTLADALKSGWNPAKSSSALVLGAKPGSSTATADRPVPGSGTVINLAVDDFFFEPVAAGTTLPAGGVVTFKIKNKGQAVHNVTSDSTTTVASGSQLGIKQVDVGALKDGEVTFKVPTRAGTYRVTCTYHPKMDLDLTVK